MSSYARRGGREDERVRPARRPREWRPCVVAGCYRSHVHSLRNRNRTKCARAAASQEALGKGGKTLPIDPRCLKRSPPRIQVWAAHFFHFSPLSPIFPPPHFFSSSSSTGRPLKWREHFSGLDSFPWACVLLHHFLLYFSYTFVEVCVCSKRCTCAVYEKRREVVRSSRDAQIGASLSITRTVHSKDSRNATCCTRCIRRHYTIHTNTDCSLLHRPCIG